MLRFGQGEIKHKNDHVFLDFDRHVLVQITLTEKNTMKHALL